MEEKFLVSDFWFEILIWFLLFLAGQIYDGVATGSVGGKNKFGNDLGERSEGGKLSERSEGRLSEGANEAN